MVQQEKPPTKAMGVTIAGFGGDMLPENYCRVRDIEEIDSRRRWPIAEI
jgi:hypothetical protein